MPVMAAKIAFAATVATPKPPLILAKTLCARLKLSLPISEALTNNPINTNKGIVANTYSEIVPWAISDKESTPTWKLCLRAAIPRNPIEKSEIDIGVPMQIRISTEIIEYIPIALSLKERGLIIK